jgi:hypothetical protein
MRWELQGFDCSGDEQAGGAYLLSRSRSELSRDAIKAAHREVAAPRI